MATILIIDDEKDVLKALRDILTEEHFKVLAATNGKQGIQVAQNDRPDLILLDLRLPDMDGYDVCRKLKENPNTASIPVLMVSTRSKETEKVVGLEIGADDYITKPYNELELLARIRVALRRKKEGSTGIGVTPSRLCFGTLKLDSESRQVFVQSKNIKLTRKEFDLLALFMSKPGKVFNRSSLLSAVWGASYDFLQGTVDSHVKNLRKKLGPAGRLIETVPGVGYRFSDSEETGS